MCRGEEGAGHIKGTCARYRVVWLEVVPVVPVVPPTAQGGGSWSRCRAGSGGAE